MSISKRPARESNPTSSIDVVRYAQAPVADSFVRRVIMEVLIREHAHGSISVAFIGARRMRKLNRTYHGEDHATDVLAFPERADGSMRGRENEQSALRFELNTLGELVLCPQVAKRNATRSGERWRDELVRLLVHGTLHLLGYDHGTAREARVMFRKQAAMCTALLL